MASPSLVERASWFFGFNRILPTLCGKLLQHSLALNTITGPYLCNKLGMIKLYALEGEYCRIIN